MPSTNLGRVVGESAYEVAVANGYVGTEQEWLASLKGDTGATGQTGATGAPGADGFSPTASVSKTGSVATIRITDKNGTTTASVYDGASTWSGISNKPFSTVGDGLAVRGGTELVLNYDETDPVFGASAAASITASDITNWNNKLSSFTESDPVFEASAAASITASDISAWNAKQDAMTITGGGDITVTVSDNNYVVSASIPTFTESDPVFMASAAASITASDISNWDAKQDALTITGGGDITVTVSDNNYTISAVAPSANTLSAGDNITITSSGGVDTISASFTFTESDPVFEASAAASITASDISAWNGKQDALTAGSNITISGNTISAAFTFTESDPVYAASPAASITASDISNWNAIVGVPSASTVTDGYVLTTVSGDAVWEAVPAPSSIHALDVHAEDIYTNDGLPEDPEDGQEYYDIHMYGSVIEGQDRHYDENEDDWLIDRNYILGPEDGLIISNTIPEDDRRQQIAVLPNIDDSGYPGVWMEWQEGKDGYEGALTLDGNGNLAWNEEVVAIAQKETINEEEGVSRETITRDIYEDGIGITRDYEEWDREADDYVVLDSHSTDMNNEEINASADFYEGGEQTGHLHIAITADTITIASEESDGEGGMNEKAVEWTMDAIQLVDRTSGDVYELAIDNGQIVLTNITYQNSL